MEFPVACFHFRRERVEVGEDVPHTIPYDVDDPTKVKGKPQVWFVKGRADQVPGFENEIQILFVHLLLLDKTQIVDDEYFEHWGVTLGTAIVQAVWPILNPKYGKEE